MAHRLAAVLVLLRLATLQLLSASPEEGGSPLDISYVFNDLNNLLHETGSSPPQPPGDYPQDSQPLSGDRAYGETPRSLLGGLKDVELSQYSNNAGDLQYIQKQPAAGGYQPPRNSYPLTDGLGQGSSSGVNAVQPGNYIHPLDNVHNPPQGAAGLSGYPGPGLPAGHYPIDIPASPPSSSSSDSQYPDTILDAYAPKKELISADPYPVGNVVPQSVPQNGRNDYTQGDDYNTGGNQPYPTIVGHRDNPNNAYSGTGLSGGSGVQIPQGPFPPQQPAPPKDLSGILYQNKPPVVDVGSHSPQILDNRPQKPYIDDVLVPGSGGLYPDSGAIGGGAVVEAYPQHPVGSAGGSVGGVGVSGGVQGGGGYGVAPQRSYPSDVQGYRDHLQCGPQFFLQYDHDFSGAVWQDVKGQVQVRQGRAVFEGQGFLAIPFFACNDLLPRYSMIFVINPTYSGSGRAQAVLGNSVFPSQASLLVSLQGDILTLVIRQRAPKLTPQQLLTQCQQPHQPHHPHYDRRRRSLGGSGGHYGTGPSTGLSGGPGFQSGQPYGPVGDIGAHYGGQGRGDIVVLQLRISGEVMVTIAQENGWILFRAGNQQAYKAGRLPTLTNEALYVGAGADPRGGGELEHYTGTFDSFLFEKCP